ncbi:endonuclease/exonuclease/phosphatase family protein [Nocardia abscessus]|uniref:endonuclease/exonuclease/phosphatase family protein n=1 Tax=Nocardia abscessus TaxID=120957 RepID=UPI0018948125|nr:endonuclease/exonuclease/phosphatase family protein [Nocardia abscessus]MBF6221769.1 endonuclease/exonuclease/phosphatase family protein [Nocardia abscessus]
MSTPPVDVQQQASQLGAAVAATIPAASANNLLIGSWNLRMFGNLSRTWQTTSTDSPKRDWRAVTLIAEVISRFDVVALQEVHRNTTALAFLLEQLGQHWHVIASDATEGDAGNDERLAFVYNSRRVQPSGLVGEIVLPPIADTPVRQFARTPYAASFVRGPTEFILTTVHVLWGDNPAQRLPEVTAFAQWMRSWADRKTDWNDNLLVLGDFNLDRIGDPLYEAFVSTGLWPPSELNTVPRTIFDDDNTNHFYDQIAWFSDPDGTSLLTSLTYTGHAGSFDFLPHCYPGLTPNEVSWRISDHYPLWIELRTQAP